MSTKRKESEEARREQDSSCRNNKRMRAEDGDDNTVSTSIPAFDVLPDELLVKILSFLHFFERSKGARSVCRRLLNVADGMPVPPSSLRIRLDADTSSPAWAVALDNDNTVIRLWINQHGKNVEQVIESLPRLGTIRPHELLVGVGSSVETVEVDARLLRHLATEVGKYTTAMRIHGVRCSSLPDLQEAFLEFERQSKGRLSNLTLAANKCSLAFVVSAVSFLRGLVELKVHVSKEMFLGWRQQADNIGLHVSTLSALPNLRTISFPLHPDTFDRRTGPTTARAVTSFLLGFCAFSRLKRIESALVCHPGGDPAVLLRRLPDLEHLHWINASHVASLAVGHAHLKELGVCCFGSFMETRASLESLANTCNIAFPLLKTLDLQFVMDLSSSDDARSLPEMISNALAELKSHPILTTLRITFQVLDEPIDTAAVYEKCQEAMGDGISVQLVERFTA